MLFIPYAIKVIKIKIKHNQNTRNIQRTVLLPTKLLKVTRNHYCFLDTNLTIKNITKIIVNLDVYIKEKCKIIPLNSNTSRNGLDVFKISRSFALMTAPIIFLNMGYIESKHSLKYNFLLATDVPLSPVVVTKNGIITRVREKDFSKSLISLLLLAIPMDRFL
jgi:hypothetical protein